MNIGGKRVLVDYERGRTVKGWLPARLGGGRNETRLGYDDVLKLIAQYRERLEQQRKQDRERQQQERARDRDRDRGRGRDRPTRSGR